MADMNVALVLRLVDQLSAPLSKAKKGLQGLREGISQGFQNSGLNQLFDPKRLDANLRANERRIAETRGRLMGAFGQALTLAAPVKLAADFDQAFKGVEKVVDAPRKRLGELRQFALKTSMMVPVAARDLLDLMAEAAQGGVPVEDLERFTSFTSRMAVAADMAGAEIGETFAKIRNTYKLNQEGIEALGDSANHLSNNMAAKAREVFAFTRRAAGAADALKLTAVEMNAIGATLVASGIVPETAATGFEVFANRLVNGGKKIEGAFKGLGTSRSEVLADFRENGAEAFVRFLEKVAAKGDAGRRILTDIVGLEYSDDFGKLLANPELLAEALELVADPANYAGSALEEAAKQSQGAAAQFQRLRNILIGAGIYIGEQLLPPLLTITEQIGALVIQATQWAQANPELFSTLVQVTAALIGLSIAMKLGAFGFAVLGGGLLRTVALLGYVGRGTGTVARLLTIAATKPALFARALRRIPKLRWATLIPRLAWRSFITPLRWLGFVPKLSWRLLIPLLKISSRILPFVGWAVLLGELAWHTIIKPLGWDKYLSMDAFRSYAAEIKNTLDGLVDRLRSWLGMEKQLRPGDDGYVEKKPGAAGRKDRRNGRGGGDEEPPSAPGLPPAQTSSQSVVEQYPIPAERPLPVPGTRPDTFDIDAAPLERAAAQVDASGKSAASAIEQAGAKSGAALGNQAGQTLQGNAAAIGAAIGAAAAAEIRKAAVNVSIKAEGAAGRKARRGARGSALADGVDGP